MGRKEDRDEPVQPSGPLPAAPANLADGSRIGIQETVALASNVAAPANPMAETMASAGPVAHGPHDETLPGASGPFGETLVPVNAPTLGEDFTAGHDATIAPTSAVVTSQRGSGIIRSGRSVLRATTDVSAGELPIVDDANYERLEEFARGGLGKISKAKDLRTGRIVALKEMIGNVDEAAKRFAREARVTANLMHPAIVPVYELGRWPSGEPFFAMKLVAGRSLQEVAAECKSLKERLARLGVLVAVADALAYAHEQHVIHRDLKPANVLVGEFGETVVIDWGLAKVVGETDPQVAPAKRESNAVIEAGSIGDRTMDGSVLGTPSYMPPEQALGNPADERADVYAIGAMLYQLLTGVTPFVDKKPRDIGHLLAMVEHQAPTPVKQLSPDVPPDLVTIVEKAMARDRSERYPSARELADDLRRFTAGQLVSAHDYDRWTLAKRWLRKHRATVIVAAALVSVLVGFAIVSLRKIVQERDTAEAEMNKAKAAKAVADHKTKEAKDSLATALYQKGRSAELQQKWADAAMYYAAARTHSDQESIRWMAGLAEARAIVPFTRHVGHTEPVTASAISRDGERVVTVDTAGAVRLWKRADGTLLSAKKLPDALWSVAYSPDGREIAVGGESGVIRRMSPFLESVGELQGHVKRVWSLAYSPDGKLLASGGEDALGRIWNLSTGEPKLLKGHTQRVYSVSFSPDGRRLASGSDDRTLWLWDVATGTGTQRGAQQNGGIRSVEFLRSGEAVAAGGWDFDLKVWPVDGSQPQQWNDRMSIHDIAVSPDGRVLVSAGDTGELRFWEVSTHDLITTIELPGGRTNTVTMSEDGRWLVTAGNDRVPVVWNIRALRRLIDAVGHRAGIAELSITADNTRAISLADDYTIRVWQLADGNEQLQIPLPTAHGKRPYCSSPVLSKAGIIAVGCEDKLIRRWDLTGRELAPIATQVYARISSLGPDDKTLAAGHMKGVGGLFDISTGKVLVEKTLHGHQIYGVRYGANGQIVTASLDNTAKLWSPTFELLRTFRIDGEDGALRGALSPDGTVVIVGAQDGALYAWEAATGKLLGKGKEHVGPIWGIAYAADQRTVYTAGEDGLFHAWDTATWKKAHTFDAGEGPGGALWITSDNKLAMTGYRNGALVVWDLATRTLRYRLGGKAREFGSCTNFAQQRWVDESHKKIVQTACATDPDAYFKKIQKLTHRRIEKDVDVVPDWEPRSSP